MKYYEKLKEKDPRAIFIAEAGINHDGDIKIAKKMIDAAAAANADYCKFQSFKANKLVTPNALTSSYIDSGSRAGESFRDVLARLELNERDHYELKEYCDNKNIKFLSTAFDEDSFDFLLKLEIDMVKVASGNLTNIPLIKHMAASGLPMFVSTGMATLSDIEDAIEAIVKEGNNQILLLHCISWYPAAIETTNLRYMNTLKTAFEFPVGYSDHTLGINMTIAARAMGAVALEKHFTLDSTRFGPDHSASIEPKEMTKLVQGIREVESGLGTSKRQFSAKEINQRKVHRTSIVISKTIKKNEFFSTDNLTIKRPGIGIRPKYLKNIIGKQSDNNIDPESLLNWNDIKK